MTTYIRFAVRKVDGDSGRGLGIFQAVNNLRDDGKLFPYEGAHLQELREWFNAHLEMPTRFTSAKPPFYRKKQRAISWFKDTAHDHLSKIREIVSILENHGVAVNMLKAERVGYVVYEDDYQIVAEPFSDLQC